MKDKIKALLGQGHSAELVSTILGCDPSYISQLLENEAFRNEVSELRVIALQAATTRDRKWDELEDKLLDKLHASADFVIKPREIAMLLSMANAAKRRGTTTQESITINNKIVTLVIPEKLNMNFSLSSNNQVIAVGEKSMMTIPSNKIQNLADKVQEAQEAQLGNSNGKEYLLNEQLCNTSRGTNPAGEANEQKEGGAGRVISKKIPTKSIKDFTAAELKDLL